MFIMNKSIAIIGILIILSLLIVLTSVNIKKDPLESLNIKYCDNFSNSYVKIMCYSLFSGNHTYCDLVKGHKSTCISFSTIKKETVEECKQLNNSYSTSICLSNLAIKNKDPSLCEKNIEKQIFLDACLMRIPYKYYKLYNKTYCEYLTHGSAKYTCFSVLDNNINNCENINEPSGKNICLAMTLKNNSYCETDTCYEQLAFLENNIELCYHIQSEFFMAECIGLISGDSEKCNYIQNEFSKELCRLYVLAAAELNI